MTGTLGYDAEHSADYRTIHATGRDHQSGQLRQHSYVDKCTPSHQRRGGVARRQNYLPARCYVTAGADLALLLIWAFVAGFSERLVPDMLTRLAKKAEEKV